MKSNKSNKYYFQFEGYYSLGKIIYPIAGLIMQDSAPLMLSESEPLLGSFCEGFYDSAFSQKTTNSSLVKALMQYYDEKLAAVQFTLFPNNEIPVVFLLQLTSVNEELGALNFSAIPNLNIEDVKSSRFADSAIITMYCISANKDIIDAENFIKSVMADMKAYKKHEVEKKCT